MDGPEATKNIRKRWHDWPEIIAIAAYALEGDRDKCLNMGMDDYISKPIQIDELRSKLTNGGLNNEKSIICSQSQPKSPHQVLSCGHTDCEILSSQSLARVLDLRSVPAWNQGLDLEQVLAWAQSRGFLLYRGTGRLTSGTAGFARTGPVNRM